MSAKPPVRPSPPLFYQHQSGDQILGKDNLQGITQVCGIGHKKKSAYSETWSAPLLQLVRASTNQLVVSWLRFSWQKLFIPHRLSFKVFFSGEAYFVAVCYTPHSIWCNFGCHIPIFWVNDKIGVPVAELVEVVVNLESTSRFSSPP